MCRVITIKIRVLYRSLYIINRDHWKKKKEKNEFAIWNFTLKTLKGVYHIMSHYI